MFAKKSIILLLIALLLLLPGCVRLFPFYFCDFKDDDIANYPDNLESYMNYRRSEYVEMDKNSEDEWSPIVPRIIPETNNHFVVQYCFFECDCYMFALDDCCQSYIVFSFDSEELFDREVERISGLTFGDSQKARYDYTLFAFPAYIVTLNHSYGAGEYILVDREKLMMYYVHYDVLSREDLKIPESFLPLDDSQMYDFSVFIRVKPEG